MRRLKYIIILCIGLAIMSAEYPKPDTYFEIVKNLDIFVTLYKEINAYYVDEVNPSTVMRTGIDAMLASLDPYTNYIPEDDIENYRTTTTGEYAGIGALVNVKDGISTVILPYEGFAADRAGLKIGDQILKINGVDIRDKSITETRQFLNGQARSEIALRVRRFGVDELLDIKLQREKITIKNIPFRGMVNENIGYIRLANFTPKAGNEVRNALLDLRELGAEKIILDLRGNPGGLLNEAVNVSNVFIPKNQEVVTTRGKMEEWTQSYHALDVATDTEIPLAVLINNESASASEIVSGVMQDYDRGVLIGQKSYGKGLVQQTRPLAYNAQLKVTTKKYYIPSGRCIQALDYSHRNADGSVGEVPDSLKREFTTTSGRIVFDGGGIDPDILVNRHDYAPVTLSLLQNNLLFYFATEYHFKHDSIDHPKTFRLSEEEYTHFVAWVKSKKNFYQTNLEHQLELLNNTAEKDANYTKLKPVIADLENRILNTKQLDLQTYQEEIQILLEQEIASRYYLERGIIESMFEKDKDILKAVRVLTDMEKYNEILRK